MRRKNFIQMWNQYNMSISLSMSKKKNHFSIISIANIGVLQIEKSMLTSGNSF